jgi:DNA-directed RNA polymerase subunit RPC12/RpoP
MISYDDGVPSGLGPTVDGVAAMSKSAYFIQECPTCGRSLQVRVEYLGRQVVCQHCRGQFLATDRVEVQRMSDSGFNLMRANELLELVEQRKARPR